MKYSRFRLNSYTKDQLLALLWRACDILPNLPLTYRNKDLLSSYHNDASSGISCELHHDDM
jgi:hypothetical protein